MSNETPRNESLQSPPEVSHDTFFTETFGQKRIAVAFLKILLPPETAQQLDWDNLVAMPRYLSAELFRGKVADVICRVPIKKSKLHIDFFIILEHKSYNDALTIAQLWGYVLRICEQNLRDAKKAKGFKRRKYRFPPVIPVIIYHGKSAFSGKTQLFDLFTSIPGIERYLPRMQAILFDLNQIDEIPNDPEVPELKAVLTILQAVFRRDIGTTAAAVIRELKQSVVPEYKRLARLIWLYLVRAAKRLELKDEEIFPVIAQEIGDDNMPSMIDIWTAKGVALGRAQGAALGEARSLLRILKTRFRAVPPHVEQRITEIGDLVVLESLTELAVTCQSLAEFEEALR